MPFPRSKTKSRSSEPPAHVAIIMDGNGRWAKARGLPRFEGHRRGVEAVRRWRFAPAEGALPRNWILRFEITRTSTQVIPRQTKD